VDREGKKRGKSSLLRKGKGEAANDPPYQKDLGNGYAITRKVNNTEARKGKSYWGGDGKTIRAVRLVAIWERRDGNQKRKYEGNDFTTRNSWLKKGEKERPTELTLYHLSAQQKGGSEKEGEEVREQRSWGSRALWAQSCLESRRRGGAKKVI